MAKIKITNKQLPFLKRDIELDEGVIKELSALQERLKARFKEDFESARSESLARYKIKIEALVNERTKAVKDFDEEIEKYKRLEKELKEHAEPPQPKRPPQRRSK